jgi:hypothetical protein
MLYTMKSASIPYFNMVIAKGKRARTKSQLSPERFVQFRQQPSLPKLNLPPPEPVTEKEFAEFSFIIRHNG